MDKLVRMHRDAILSIAAENGATNVRLFGSRARGDAREDSDVDLLIQLGAGRTLYNIVAIKQDVEEVLGCKVDVITEASLDDEMREEVLRQAILL